MNVCDYTVTAFRIDDVMNKYRIDPVRVILEDIEPGKGRMTVVCFARAWTAYWGSMGQSNDVESFARKCDADYLCGSFVPNRKDEGYVGRIASAVIDALEVRHARRKAAENV